MTGARASLKGIAARAGVRTRPANMSYPGVWENFNRRATFTSDDVRVEIYADATSFYLTIDRNSGIVFETPNVDWRSNVLLGRIADLAVYVMPNGQTSPAPWIHSAEAEAALRSLGLNDDETVSVSVDGLSGLIISAGVEADWERLQRFIAFALALPASTPEEPLDPNKLRDDLRDLFGLFKRWAKTDDGERSDVVERANTKSLEKLVEQCNPRLRQIAEVLAQPEFANSNEGGALDALAQAVMEAELELRRRRK